MSTIVKFSDIARSILGLSSLKWIVTGIFILMLLPLQKVECSALNNINDYYKQGLEKERQGNYKEALEIWSAAKNELNEPDFRISYSYIELVSRENLADFYTEASEIYFWGLKGEIDSFEKEALMKELDYIRPLIDRKRFKDIESQIEDSESRP